MANKENLPPTSSPSGISRLSPNNKPALSRQRDHSACRRPETPLKVRKTRENLRQQSVYPDIPPPCVHAVCEDKRGTGPGLVSSTSFIVNSPTTISAQSATGKNAANTSSYQHDQEERPDATPGGIPQPGAQVQRQKSLSRRMLSRVKQGMSTTRSRSTQSVRPTESETSVVRRISGRRKQSREGVEQRARSFDISRNSIDSQIDETVESGDVVPSVEQRSFTASTVSTAELLGPASITRTHEIEHEADGFDLNVLSPVQSSSSSLNPTPRPPPRSELPTIPPVGSGAWHVPCVDLNVTLSSASVDLHSKHDVWVAIEARIRTLPTISDTQRETKALSKGAPSSNITSYELNSSSVDPSRQSYQGVCGTISTLRLCYKPVGGCTVRDFVGQKSFRDLTIGQQCSLFIKVHVPRLRIKDPSSSELDQNSLFAELESIVGTLKMEILHVEVRYRHSLLPFNNVVTVRHTCKIKRPKMESRWSLVGTDNANVDNGSSGAHALLAKYLASHYSAEEALGMLQRHLDPSAQDHPIVREFRESLTAEINRSNDANSAPSVVVTDSELDINTSGVGGQSSCPSGSSHRIDTMSVQRPSKHHEAPQASLTIQCVPQQSTIASPQTNAVPSNPPTAPSPPHPTLRPPSPSPSPDSARQLWRHIRRNSLSASHQLSSIPSSNTNNVGIQHLDIYDEATKALHRQAVANKRSVGAETLRAWKWDQSVTGRAMPEAPWM